MAYPLERYIEDVIKNLQTCLYLRNFPSLKIERHNKPEVETQESAELRMPEITIKRSEKEKTLIEPSINSARVSFLLKKNDDLDRFLASMFVRFISLRAEEFYIMRRMAVSGYDISFLFTHVHLEELAREQLMAFLRTFLKEIDREISEMRITVNTRARAAATFFVSNLLPRASSS